jgi:hypothetical protein
MNVCSTAFVGGTGALAPHDRPDMVADPRYGMRSATTRALVERWGRRVRHPGRFATAPQKPVKHILERQLVGELREKKLSRNSVLDRVGLL